MKSPVDEDFELGEELLDQTTYNTNGRSGITTKGVR